MSKLPIALFAAVGALSLQACATSAEGLGRTSVEDEWTSNKTPVAIATCVSQRLSGNNPVANEGEHYWVVRTNGYGIPIARWDIYPTPAGSRIEFRQTISIDSGVAKAATCF